MSAEEVELTPQQLIAQSAKATAEALTDALTSRSAPIALPSYDWESRMRTGHSLCFKRHSTIGSSSTESRQTAKITSATSLQHSE